LSYLANTQTNKLWQKHNLLGGGNNNNILFWVSCQQFIFNVILSWSFIQVLNNALRESSQCDYAIKCVLYLPNENNNQIYNVTKCTGSLTQLP